MSADFSKIYDLSGGISEGKDAFKLGIRLDANSMGNLSKTKEITDLKYILQVKIAGRELQDMDRISVDDI